jgi:hypothetical protein
MTTQSKNQNPVKPVTTTEEKTNVQDHVINEVTVLPQIIQTKTALSVFERLDEGIKMREHYNKFKDKVDEFDNFAKSYSDEALVLEIQNVGAKTKVSLQSVPMILDFIRNVVVKTGREHLTQMEKEIVNFSL